MEIFSLIVIIIFGALVLNAFLIFRLRIFDGKWPSRKKIVLYNLIIVFIVFMYSILPKSNGNCKVTIAINNKNSNSEIIINKKYTYNLVKNEAVELNNMSSSGQIGIKTKDEAKFIVFSDDTHLFNYDHTIKIDINSNKIKISSFSLSINTIIDGIEKYDKIIEIIK